MKSKNCPHSYVTLHYDPNQPSPHNTLRWIQPGFGYCINTLAVDDTLEVSGNPIPVDTPLELNWWWNLVAYLPESSMDVPTALESIGGENIHTRRWTGSYRVVRGFDLKGIEHGQGADGALTFDPTLPEHFSTLKLMMNNFGYWIKIKEDATDTTLIYPVGGGQPKAVASVQSQYPRGGDFTFTPTLEWVDFYGSATVDGHSVMPGDVVTVYDKDGVQCGGFVVHTEGMIGFIPVYGDDKTTTGVDEGAEEGDRLSFFINDRPAEDLSQGSLIWTRDGDIRQVVLSVVGVESLDVPKEYALFQNYPNPFNAQTEIVYQLPEESHVRLVVYNLMGQVVRMLVDDSLSAGSYSVLWDGKDEEGVEVGSGIYFYRINAQGSGTDEFVSVKRIVVLK